jgi:hypothetical protein
VSWRFGDGFRWRGLTLLTALVAPGGGRYYDSVLTLLTSFMKIVALSLDVPEDTFDPLCRLPAAAIRLL